MRFATLVVAAAVIAAPCFATDPKPAPSTKKTASVPAWESVDPAFQGCGGVGACGARGRNDAAIVQPGAKIGQLTYCPVSGAVFEVKAESPKAEVDGKPMYFCCEACAQHFAKHREEVLAKRK